MEQHITQLWLTALPGFILLAGILFAFAFWIWMLVDAIKNPSLNSNEKLIWVLVIIFLNWLGGLIYFFVGRERPAG